jgi:hypothetical protein
MNYVTFIKIYVTFMGFQFHNLVSSEPDRMKFTTNKIRFSFADYTM